MSDDNTIAVPRCRICGKPVTDSRNMMEEVSVDIEGLAFVCHRACWLEAESRVYVCDACSRVFGLVLPYHAERKAQAEVSCPFCGAEL